MEIPVKTNRLAMASFATGLIALLLTFGWFFLRISLFNAPDGSLLMPENPTMNSIEFWSPWVSRSGGLAILAAVITGVLALREIKAQGGIERGRFFAWAGIVLAAAWVVFRMAIALFFIAALFRPFS